MTDPRDHLSSSGISPSRASTDAEVDLAARSISGALLRLRASSPFFSVLSLFAGFRASDAIATAATDGETVFYNPVFVLDLPRDELDGVVLHEVLHAALMHAIRRGTRDPRLWGVAADVVVNGIIAKLDGFSLVPGAIREPSMEDLRVEEVYDLLERCEDLHDAHSDCLIGADPGEGSNSLGRLRALEEHWQGALRQAEAVARSSAYGSLPAGLAQVLAQVGREQIDWRSVLWRFLVRTPSDFSGFDRRFLHRKLYLDALEGETLRVYVAIDSSGSIRSSELSTFLGEVRGVLRAYPHLEGELYYADADLYGPYVIHDEVATPRPRGGGGTSFVPFFDRIARENLSEGVCIYLTDGEGRFPSVRPALPVLWVVTAGGLPDDRFPFGEVARLIST